MKNIVRIFPLALALAFLASCGDLYGTIGGDDINLPGALPQSLAGQWVFPATGAPAERYIIDSEAGTFQYIDYSGTGFGFSGHIRFVSNFSSSSGIIIIEYIEPPLDWGGTNPFFGIYYRNITGNTVQLANSFDLVNRITPDTATLDEATRRFTRGRMGRYVDWGVVQPQWRAPQ